MGICVYIVIVCVFVYGMVHVMSKCMVYICVEVNSGRWDLFYRNQLSHLLRRYFFDAMSFTGCWDSLTRLDWLAICPH